MQKNKETFDIPGKRMGMGDNTHLTFATKMIPHQRGHHLSKISAEML
jgi:hypothetical protein